MSSLVERFNEFRGSRPALAISTTIFLGLGAYLLLANAELPPRLGGVLCVVLGLLAGYELVIGESVAESLS